jgi:hypothetical protein
LRREGHTPVFRLDTATFSITAVETTGTPPGWIGKHRVIEGEPAESGFRLTLHKHHWEPVPWLPGATK